MAAATNPPASHAGSSSLSESHDVLTPDSVRDKLYNHFHEMCIQLIYIVTCLGNCRKDARPCIKRVKKGILTRCEPFWSNIQRSMQTNYRTIWCVPEAILHILGIEYFLENAFTGGFLATPFGG